MPETGSNIMTNRNDRISIQVGLSGYSFRIYDNSGLHYSGWKNADSFFTTTELQHRYSNVEIAVFTPYCTLVPEDFFRPESAREQLSEVVRLPENSSVKYLQVPEYGAVMIYSDNIDGTLHKVVSESVLRTDGTKAQPYPEMYCMLKELSAISEYNRILASYCDGVLYLAIAQGKTLMLCNSYQAQDFTTAEYYIFLAMKKFQLNPEVSTVTFRTPLTMEQEMSLYRYFRSVDVI